MARDPDSRTVWNALLSILAVSAVIAAPVAGAGVQFQGPSGAEVVDRVEQRYDTAETVAGSAVVRTTNGTETVESNVSFAYAAPDSYRLVVERDGETFRTGSNGTVAWAVGPRGTAVWDADAVGQRTAAQLPAGAEAVSLAVPTELDIANVSATVEGSTTVDGTAAYELRIAPGSGPADGTTTLFVAKDDSRVLRAVTTDGTNRTVVDVTELRFNVSIHESTFQPPSERIDASSFQRYDSYAATQAGTSLDLPRLDEGTFTGATVTVQQGDTIVAQRYALDGENVTVISTTATDRFEQFSENASTVRIDGREASVSRMQERSVVAWTDENGTTAVVVDGSTERAIEIARML